MGELYKLEFSDGKLYIGATKNGALRRFAGHKQRFLAGGKPAKFPVYKAWSELGEPTLSILAVVPDDMLGEIEARAISSFGTMLPGGYNYLPGGASTPFQEERHRAYLLGNKHALGSIHPFSEEHIVNLSKAMKGNKNALGNRHGIGNKNASGKRSLQQIQNIKDGVRRAKERRESVLNGEKNADNHR